MDRSDEAKHVRSNDDNEEPARSGDILGLGGSAVPKAPGDPSTEFDEASVARRRARAGGADDVSVEDSELHRTPGATGIDMGAGGSGTDVE